MLIHRTFKNKIFIEIKCITITVNSAASLLDIKTTTSVTK